MGGRLVLIVGGGGQYDAALLSKCRSTNNNDAKGGVHFHLLGRRRGVEGRRLKQFHQQNQRYATVASGVIHVNLSVW